LHRDSVWLCMTDDDGRYVFHKAQGEFEW